MRSLELDLDVVLKCVAVLPAEPSCLAVVLEAADADFAENRVRVDCVTASLEDFAG